MASSSAQSAGAARLLQNQLKEMQKADDLPGISVGLVNDSNIFEWEVILMINDDCKYYGGTWSSQMPCTSCFSMSAHLVYPLPPHNSLFFFFSLVTSYTNIATFFSYRSLLPCAAFVPARVPDPATEDDLLEPRTVPSQHLPGWRP